MTQGVFNVRAPFIRWECDNIRLGCINWFVYSINKAKYDPYDTHSTNSTQAPQIVYFFLYGAIFLLTLMYLSNLPKYD
jgi:hypothetical protein